MHAHLQAVHRAQRSAKVSEVVSVNVKRVERCTQPQLHRHILEGRGERHLFALAPVNGNVHRLMHEFTAGQPSLGFRVNLRPDNLV